MAEQKEIDIFKCDICSKTLDVPKRLACLHNFCHSCLCQHIEKAIATQIVDERHNQFRCPVCKTVIQLPDKATQSLYVNSLPTNHLLQALIQRKRIKPGEEICAWCLHKGQKQPAKVWCDECSEGLCKECSKFHKKNKTLKSHELIRIEDVSNLNTKLHFEILCPEHKGKIIENFCHDHQTTCCSSCFTDYHRKCKNVTTIDKVSKDQEQSTSDLMETIQDILVIANDFLDERYRNCREIEKERREVIENIRSLRNEIVVHLEKLEKNFQQMFDENHAKIKREIEDEIEVCSNHRAIATNCKEVLSLSVTHSSDENLFTEKQIIEKKIKEEMELVKQLTAEAKMRRYEIVLAPELVNLTKRVTSLGSVNNTIGTTVQLTVQPFQKVPSSGHKPTKYFNVQHILSFNPEQFPVGKIHGAKILNDGQILLTNVKRKLLLIFDRTGNLKQEIDLPGAPRDVTMIGDQEAAVSYRYPNGIAVIDIITGNIKQNNIMKNQDVEVCGVTSDGEKLVAACEKKILVMDKTGSIIRDIKTPNTNDQRYLCFVADTRLCYSDRNPPSVHCIDHDGSEVFTYKHKDLSGPYAITCDDEGVIYVTGLSSNNVHQIAPDGDLIKILLTKESGIENPLAIDCNTNTKTLILTHSNKTISVYSLK